MNEQEAARERLAEQRHHDEHVKETMLNRAEHEVMSEEERQAQSVEEGARQLMAEHRQHKEQVKESLLRRSEDEVGFPHDEEDQD
ncbi:hypothetical protein [Geitlerinema sp. PCC 7407]|uniref:hypothetical protein n=1 Tax=Geitlerinema sp. PCC 7407 TaxID=1173025 RepID=UPI00029FB7E5|nr:hypothetical protein [Geitlerinema sp. PCC 7407]AFY65196.1 hypothetical protein GEI7407_0698 [Geitlerinema sp. PCC 7407]